MKKKIFSPSNILTAMIYMLFIISFSVVIVLNFRPLYYSDIDRLGIEDFSGLPKEKIKENYDSLISYNSMFNNEELSFPDLAMSENGKIHFEEVKDIFVAVQYLCIITFIAAAALTLWKRHSKNYGFLKLASLFTIIIPLLLGILIAMNWENFFVTFHHIFFNNDYWIFDASTDPIINLLPDTFFMHCAIAILALVIIGSVVCYLIFRKLYSSRKSIH